MASAAAATPSRAGADGAVNIPVAPLPPSQPAASTDARAEAEAILEALNQALAKADHAGISQLFVPDGFWRDHLALSWEFRTARGRDEMAKFLGDCARSRDGLRLRRLTLDTGSRPSRAPRVVALDVEGKSRGIQAFFSLETVVGSGQGIARLVTDGTRWRIFTLYTSLSELRGHEEALCHRRPLGTDSHSGPDGENWLERRQRQGRMEEGEEPAVIIVGAGQAGLSVAARLKALGVRSLIIDRHERVGDNWRKRYRSLVLHDPVWYDHLPYLSFPPQWPVFTPKDKLGNFLEAYAELLELDVWTSTQLRHCAWDAAAGAWTVTVSRSLPDGSSQSRDFRPRHLIQATGHSGLKNQPSFKGAQAFRGRRFCHSSDFPGVDALPAGAGINRAVVVGSCNSAHDVAQDYAERGYEVTMVQRSSTCVVSSSSMVEVALKSAYGEDGPPTEDADLMTQSVPSSVSKATAVQINKVLQQHDAATLSGLARAGFKTNEGPDGGGLLIQYPQRGGGYYIDVGGSQLIIDGRIKVRQGQQVDEVLPHGLRLSDGSELTADEIVLATGYQDMHTQTRAIFGPEVAARVKDVWGFDAEGELRGMWRPSGQAGFWFHGGNLALCRYYSKLLALQIKAQEEGLYRHGET